MMGTTELALPKIVEILGPDGEYEKGRIRLRSETPRFLPGQTNHCNQQCRRRRSGS